MSKTKVIIILMVLILVLIIALAIRINTTDSNQIRTNLDNKNTISNAIASDTENSTKEKSVNELTSNVNEVVNNLKQTNERLKTERAELNKQMYSASIGRYIIPLLIAGILWILWIAGVQKISSDLEMPVLYRVISVAILLLSVIVAFISLYNGNTTNFKLFMIIAQISIIISLMGIFYKVGVNVVLIILALASVFIPVVGNYIYLGVFAYGMWLLGDHYDKSTGFKIGLILLNIIGLPAMAFDWKFIK